MKCYRYCLFPMAFQQTTDILCLLTGGSSGSGGDEPKNRVSIVNQIHTMNYSHKWKFEWAMRAVNGKPLLASCACNGICMTLNKWAGVSVCFALQCKLFNFKAFQFCANGVFFLRRPKWNANRMKCESPKEKVRMRKRERMRGWGVGVVSVIIVSALQNIHRVSSRSDEWCCCCCCCFRCCWLLLLLILMWQHFFMCVCVFQVERFRSVHERFLLAWKCEL